MKTAVELKGLDDAWMEPDGTLHEVPPYGHEAWATDNQGCWGDNLYDLGWIKVSGSVWLDNDFVTQAQLDVIFDWHVANEQPFKAEQFTVK